MSRLAARRLIRVAGWLLTPLVAWAAAFLGGWIGALVGKELPSPGLALACLIGGAVIGGAGGAGVWLWALIRAGRMAGSEHVAGGTVRGA